MLVIFYDIDSIGYDYDSYNEEIMPRSHEFSDPIIIKKLDIIPAKNSIMEIDDSLYKLVCVQHHTTTIGCDSDIHFYACYMSNVYLNSTFQSNYQLENILTPFLRKEKIKNLLE